MANRNRLRIGLYASKTKEVIFHRLNSLTNNQLSQQFLDTEQVSVWGLRCSVYIMDRHLIIVC